MISIFNHGRHVDHIPSEDPVLLEELSFAYEKLHEVSMLNYQPFYYSCNEYELAWRTGNAALLENILQRELRAFGNLNRLEPVLQLIMLGNETRYDTALTKQNRVSSFVECLQVALRLGSDKSKINFSARDCSRFTYDELPALECRESYYPSVAHAVYSITQVQNPISQDLFMELLKYVSAKSLEIDFSHFASTKSALEFLVAQDMALDSELYMTSILFESFLTGLNFEDIKLVWYLILKHSKNPKAHASALLCHRMQYLSDIANQSKSNEKFILDLAQNYLDFALFAERGMHAVNEIIIYKLELFYFIYRALRQEYHSYISITEGRPHCYGLPDSIIAAAAIGGDIYEDFLKRYRDKVSIKISCGKANSDEIVRLVEDNWNIEITDAENIYQIKNPEILNIALKHQSPNYYLKNGRTPLYFAALDGDIARVKILLKHGADKNHQDSFGKTVKDYVASEFTYSQPNIKESLIAILS